jgi:hypothetical protein
MIKSLKRAFKTMGKSLSALALAGSMLMPFGTAGCGPKSPQPHVNNAPVLDILVDQNAPVSTAFLYDTNATDPDGDTITYSESGPTWLNVNPTNGLLSGTPSEADLGSKTSVTVRATDEHGLYDEKSFDVSVYSNGIKNLTGQVHQIVLTTDSFKPTFQRLADEETREGCPTQIITIEDIVADSTYASGRDTQEKARFFLQDQKLAHPELEYLIITEGVPIRELIAIYSSTEYPIQSLWYFMDIDDGSGTYSWNYDYDANANNKFGEWADGIDGLDGGIKMRPELKAGFIPGSNAAEINTIIDKYLQERRNAPACTKKVLSCASVVSLVPYVDTAEAIHFTDNTTVNYPGNGYTLKELFESGYMGQEVETRAKVIANINANQNFVTIDGQGNEESVYAGDLDFTRTDARALTNTSRPLVYVLSCFSGAFNYAGGSLAKALLDNPNGGASAVVAASHLHIGSSSPGADSGWKSYNRFCDYLFNQNNTEVGEALKKARINDLPFVVPGADDVKFNLFSYTLWGAPRTQMFTDNHGILVPVKSARTDCLEVTVTDGANPVSGANVTIMQGTDIYSVSTNPDGKVVLPTVPTAGDTITATMPNYTRGDIN